MKRLLELATFSLLSASLVARAQAPLPAPPPTTTAPAQTPAARSDVEAVGQAPIANGDRVRARQRALDESCRAAVEQAATALVGAAGLAERASLLKLQIYPKARTYIGSYRVLEEGDQGGSVFRMRIAAVVDLARLERDLAPRTSVGRAPGRPASAAARAWLCTDDAGVTVTAPANTSERVASALAVALARAGGASLGAAGLMVTGDGACPRAPDPGARDRGAAMAARTAGAQAAIIAGATATDEGRIRGTSLSGAHAAFELRLLELDGQVIGTGRGESDGIGADAQAARMAAASEALEGAVAAIAPSVARRFPSAGAEGENGVAAHLEAGTPWADLQLFEKDAAAIPGVAAVEPRRFSQNGIELFLRGDVTAPAIAAALARLADGARFLVAPQGDHALTVHIAPAPEPAASPQPPPPPQPLPAPPPVPR